MLSSLRIARQRDPHHHLAGPPGSKTHWFDEGNKLAEANFVHMRPASIATVERFRDGSDAAGGLVQSSLAGRIELGEWSMTHSCGG